MTTWRMVVRMALFWLSVVAVAIVAAGCAGVSSQRPTMLTGAQEVPRVSTGASGSADVSIDWFKCPSAASSKNCPTIVGTVATSGIQDTGVEIREGGPGQTGPVIVSLVRTGEHVWSVPSGTTVTDVQYRAYLAGQLYVNVDSATHKNGEIRTQLRP